MIVECDDFQDLLQSVRSLGNELSSLKNNAKKLVQLDDESGESEKKHSLEKLTPAQRRERSRSAWARSTTARDNTVGTRLAEKRSIGSIGTVSPTLNITQATNAVKKRSPAFSFGARSKALSDMGDLDVEVPAPTQYEVQVAYLSTLSRTRSCVMRPPSARLPQPEAEAAREGEGEEVEVIEVEEVVS
ncbi:hypothetical protein EON64_13565, partial [archaeon]